MGTDVRSEVKRKRSRHLHFGVVQLCEVMYNRIGAGKQRLFAKNTASFGKVAPAAEALELIAQDLKFAASTLSTPRERDDVMMRDLKEAALRAGVHPEELLSPGSPNHYDLGLPDDPFAAFQSVLDDFSPIEAVRPAAMVPPAKPMDESVSKPLVLVNRLPLRSSESRDLPPRSRSATMGGNQVGLRSSRDDSVRPLKITLTQPTSSNNSSPTLTSPRSMTPPPHSGAASQPGSRGSLIDSYYGTEIPGMDERLRKLLRASEEPVSVLVPASSAGDRSPLMSPVVSKSWAKQKYFGLSEDEQVQLEFLLNTEVEVLFLWADSLVRRVPFESICLTLD